MAFGIWLVLLGVLAASNLIIARKPDAEKLLGKVAPYQGWIGAVSVVAGAVWIINAVLNIAAVAHRPFGWLVWMLGAVLLAALGLLLGVGVVKTFVQNETARARMDQVIARLAPYQGKLGIVAIVVGLWNAVFNLWL